MLDLIAEIIPSLVENLSFNGADYFQTVEMDINGQSVQIPMDSQVRWSRSFPCLTWFFPPIFQLLPDEFNILSYVNGFDPASEQTASFLDGTQTVQVLGTYVEVESAELLQSNQADLEPKLKVNRLVS